MARTVELNGSAVTVVVDAVAVAAAADEGLVASADLIGVVEGHGLEGHALVDALGVSGTGHGSGNAGEEEGGVGNHLD